MGAEQFRVIGRGDTVQQAFFAAREQALYDYGHSGYTGTIAEKAVFILYDVPSPYTYKDVVQALENGSDQQDLEEIFGKMAGDIFFTYDDKWGPAVALATDEDNKWVFLGWASC